ncbi:hypothetical protein PHABIO_237 [Pseudomonas phage Phabio]|uniref:Uncharacterized protein n=1 Tax=Pseudomonas phage Phabio TaxID=2006668 RepID=A0A1Y0T062_9CAUD|nr:baseplate assembly protein [Pseudomonas phage Phabio]ARV76868.1 hypothetical protein PHABIO_237 [Pseudomonas phage Phabio]
MAQVPSIFHPYSIGQVTIPKDRKSRFINALPVEIASGTDGEVTHAPQEDILKGFNEDGTEYQVKSTSARDIECEWLPMEGNRVTPPDVQRGELVMIYRLGDTSQYFWTCMGLRNHLRTLESVITMYGATPNISGCGLDFSNCYYSIWSPMDGHITFSTSKANGEEFRYTFQINAKDSFAGLTDDVGNYMEINSAAGRCMFKNAAGSIIRAEKQIIDLIADSAIHFTVGGTKMSLTPSAIDSKTETDTKTATTVNRNGTTINDKSTTYNNTATRWNFI